VMFRLMVSEECNAQKPTRHVMAEVRFAMQVHYGDGHGGAE
jgi:hypothetical protein